MDRTPDKFESKDYLNQELEGNSMMFMISNALRVGLLTDHLPVKDVSAAITPELIETKIKTVSKPSDSLGQRRNKSKIIKEFF